MPKTLARRLGWVLAAAACGIAPGQRIGTESTGVAAWKAQATELRDSFVEATVAAGMSCASAPPKIVVEDVPGYASYDSSTNTVKTGT